MLVDSNESTTSPPGNFNTNASIIVTETLFEGDSLLAGYTHTVTMNAAEYAAAATQFGVQV